MKKAFAKHSVAVPSPWWARPWLIVVALAAVVFAVYGGVGQFQFTNYDDPDYMTDNLVVKAGLSLRGVWWALTTGHASNWHPVTWLSHMTDATLFGANAGGHHFTNVLLHAANTALLFALLRKLTGAVWRSAAVAALWAVHPLHVESVAWVSERKDMLSGLFGLLTLWCYAGYAQARGAGREARVPTPNAQRLTPFLYPLALLFFALGLMSKPMLVTWPLVMLLLDYWPLRRFELATINSQLSTLLREKLPFFALSAASCVITVLVQKAGGAVQTVQDVPWISRLENTPVAYARYLGKTFWPVDLIVPYTHPGHWPLMFVFGGVLLLLAVSVLVVRAHRRAPFLLFGWLWFVGTLVPVIGLLQVGGQSMADRYTYLPHIGLFIALVWGGAEGVRRWALGVRLGLALLILAACAVRAHDQLRYWRSTETLFRHTLAIAPENALAMQNLGVALVNHGRVPEAFALFRNALEVIAHDQVITSLEQAMKDLETATNAQPRTTVALTDLAGGHRELAAALARKARYADAIRHYERALEFVPDDALSHYNLGLMFSITGQTDAAIAKYERALALDPTHVEAHNNLAVALASLGKFAEAVPHLETAVRLRPDYGEAHKNLGIALAKLNRRAEAIMHLREALRLNPADSVAQTQLRELGANTEP